MNPEIQCLADVTRFHAKVRPEYPALVFEGRETSWVELDANASRISQGLCNAGVTPRTAVAYLGRNTDAYFEILFGSVKAGAFLAVLNWRLADPEIAWVLEDSQARVLFVAGEYCSLLERIRSSLHHLELVICIGEDRPGFTHYERWRDGHPDRDAEVGTGADDPQIQLYTSGTTGRPKGAQLSNRSLMNSLRLLEDSGEDFNRIDPDDANLVHLPVFHIGATGFAFDHLYYGVTQIILRQFEAGAFLECLERYRIRRTCLAPTMIQMVLEHSRCRPECFRRLEYLIYGGSPIHLDLLQRALAVMSCKFVQQYGMTESTGLATYLPPEDHDPAGNARMRSAGRPYRSVRLKVVDAEGRDLGPHQTGEICIDSPCLMVGYLGNPEATRDAIRGGWLHTGDAGFVDNAGYLYVQDRVKDMIVSGAENIYPAEVENAIASHPGVRMVAVVGVPDPKWGEVVKAVVVRAPSSTVSEQEIIQHALKHIARYKRPRSVDFVDEIPVNPSGKILRRLVREPYWVGMDRRVG